MKRILLLSLVFGFVPALLHAQEDESQKANVKVYEFDIEEETDGSTAIDRKVVVRSSPAEGADARGNYNRKNVVLIEMDKNGHGDRVKLEMVENEKGTTYKKLVNGEEVEVNEVDKKKLQSRAPVESEGLLNMYGLKEIDFYSPGQLHELRVMGDSMQQIFVRKFENLPELENLEYDMEELREHLKHLQAEMEDFHPNMSEKLLETQGSRGKLSTYPNPSEGQFRLEYKLKEKVEASYRVVDASGKAVMEKDLGVVDGRVNEMVDLSGRAPGIYIIEFQAGDELEKIKVILD